MERYVLALKQAMISAGVSNANLRSDIIGFFCNEINTMEPPSSTNTPNLLDDIWRYEAIRCTSHGIAAYGYFQANPSTESTYPHALFRAGYERGFDDGVKTVKGLIE